MIKNGGKERNSIKTMLMIVLTLFLCAFCAFGCHDEYKPVDDIPFTVAYNAMFGGRIEGEITQRIHYGEDAREVTAIAEDGYYFVGWSDGVNTATRRDVNIKDHLHVEAEFLQISDGICVTYRANVDTAFINGYGKRLSYSEIEQTIQRGTDCWEVEAELPESIATNGLEFLQWSDGVKTAWRHDKNITESFEVTALYCYPIKYDVDGEGRIMGETEQMVLYSERAQTVTAVPETGYRFVTWSDGVKTATRQDIAIKPIDVYAIFEWRETDDFAYHYNYATENYAQDNLTLTRGSVDCVAAVVPEREFFTFEGWYLDEFFTDKAFDSNGNNLLGEEIFNSPSRDLYAKWTVKDEYVVTYKILMVYITAVDGTFVGNEGEQIEVHYRISDITRQLYNEITKRFSDYLNSMLDGLVKFEVDSYFTTQSIGEKNFSNRPYDKSIYADEIPELVNSDILNNYRSVLTTFSLGQIRQLYPNYSGIAHIKYGCVPIDELLRSYDNIQSFLSHSVDPEFDWYNNMCGTYVHEFIHTIEQGITCYEYHEAYHSKIPTAIKDKLYLLNQWACGITGEEDIDEMIDIWEIAEKGGIPYSAWTNQILTVSIEAECINGLSDGSGGIDYVDHGGYISHYRPGDLDGWSKHEADYNIQKVPKGSRSTWLFAKAKPGYKFLYWSDGVTNPLRKLADVQEDVALVACFERLFYTVEYKAQAGGHIEGEKLQTAFTGDRYTSVTAIADDGYEFIGWSDGQKNAVRYDYAGETRYDPQSGELIFRGDFVVVAIFTEVEF